MTDNRQLGAEGGVSPLRRILVANRGEIALRIIRACHEEGLEAVAVYSDADRLSPHVRAANAAVALGAPPAAESYLDIAKLIAAATATGCQAIHPGYGFLSERPRHIEIQILADRSGRVVSLGERECSIQRRHQKLIEEAPSVAVTPALRRRLGEAATAAAGAVGYLGAGTIEFLLAPTGEFYFLEMNTRIQVEHPVTELVYGVDLVREQLRIANGESMRVRANMEPRGHAIECRITAEDPFKGFLPAAGI